jgi:hypothetical protein
MEDPVWMGMTQAMRKRLKKGILLITQDLEEV